MKPVPELHVNFSVSRIQRTWSTSFIYSMRRAGKILEWFVLASYCGQTLRVCIQGSEGVRSLSLPGFKPSELQAVKRIKAADLCQKAQSTCYPPELDVSHYFVTVLSNTINMGRAAPISAERLMEIMEVVSDLRESADPERLHDYLAASELLDLEDNACTFRPSMNEFEFWDNHWASIASRILEDFKRANRGSKT
ncbi:hypothetical protein IFT48_01375 [Pseudomonas fluorescens]|nr:MULTISPECIES: hypothetical protein [Pseudomonas]MBD8088625.1 hypothetical protein [Pseudomonas fluorescens]MBD8681402.1 hypothetical protein [Pseudomonas sp. CFBP 13719]